MSLVRKLTALVKDPPPAYVFELSEAGISMARIGAHAGITFRPLAPGVISVSPLRDNILIPDDLAAAVRELAPVNGNRKRRDAALVLPDNCVRISVLDFDHFPSDAREQLSLVRFRMKKSVPFDVEEAAVSYWAQAAWDKRVDVVAVVTPLEIVARYEAPFRAAGLNPEAGALPGSGPPRAGRGGRRPLPHVRVRGGHPGGQSRPAAAVRLRRGLRGGAPSV